MIKRLFEKIKSWLNQKYDPPLPKTISCYVSLSDNELEKMGEEMSLEEADKRLVSGFFDHFHNEYVLFTRAGRSIVVPSLDKEPSLQILNDGKNILMGGQNFASSLLVEHSDKGT
jgi:hypothetical protein